MDDCKKYEEKIKELEKKLDNLKKFTGFCFTNYPNYPFKKQNRQGYWELYSIDFSCFPISEHRYLMEMELGFKLPKDFVVHHKDGNKGNNKLINLEVMSKKDHGRFHRKKGNNTNGNS